MNLLHPVSKIMSTKLLTLNEDDSIGDAKVIFDNNRIHHIPILRGNELAGIVSKSDYLAFLNGVDKGAVGFIDEAVMEVKKINSIMTSGVATMESTEKVNVALEIFTENLFHCIPIVDDKKLVGLITTFDIIKKLNEDNGAHASYDDLP